MLTSFWKTLVFLGALLSHDAYAQQYLGDVIPNATYPGVPGSELAYFRVKDPAGKNNNLTLVNYYSLGSNGKRLVPSKIKRAVIIIHGLNRDPGTYMSNMLSALSQEKSDSNINFDSVAIMAPSFPNGDDKNVSYPYWDYPPGAKKKASGGAQSWTNLLVWKGSQWAGGGTNQYPTKAATVSSYEVLDQLISYFGDKSTFPNINQIVIAGHSLGGQTVQRYATVGKPLSSIGVSTPVTYWIANPNSLVWLNSSRPLSTASCADYDDWRDGLSSYSSYPSVYNTDLVASGSAAVIANYQSKNKAYARGTQDMGDDSSGCAPFTTGNNRHERFFYFINWWTPTCEAPTSPSGHCDTVDLIPMGHDGGGMMASSAGRARLFTDNFYGTGTRAYDAGYPRIQANVDDPFPDPAYNESTSSEDKTVYAGNMTFAGCYTDSSSRTLATLIYDSTSNTIEKCTTACANAGYSIAGTEYGSQCYCDNYLGPYTQKALDLGCSQACAGNSSQTCGNSNRLSVYSNGTPVQASAPSNPEVVGNYFYSGCHSEATSGRALAGPSYSDGKNMTLENCAAFCNGYKYFGIEYAAECYCGSGFGTGSAVAADSSCSMVCNGNSLELCGGPGALSVYQLQADAPVSTITQGSTTAGSAPTNTNTAAAIPSASLCPATNGQNIADSNNVTYTIGCSSDTSIGSYSSAQASNSYFDCMTACDSAASTGCVAWTYVGGTYGSGSGTCYLKNSQGSFTSAASNLVSGFKSSTGVTSTTTSSAAPAATTYANGSTPVVGGVTYSIETDTTYSGTLMTLSKKRATTVVGDCLRICAASGSCVATAFDGDSSTCTYYSVFDKNSKSTDVGTTFATVQARGSATTTSSSSTGLPSASLCPSTNGQTVNGYSVSCSSDTNVGSYTSKQAASSYLDCMSACDSAASTGCVAWTYVGGTYGGGSGTCWLKNSKGAFTSAGTNYISGMASSQGSSSSSSSVQSASATSSTASLGPSSSTTSASSSATASSNLCPSVDSQDISDSNNNVYTIRCSSDTTVGSFTNTQAVNSYVECMTACDSTTGCVAFTYVGGTYGSGSGTCWLKNDRGSASSAGSNFVAGFLKNTVTSSSSVVSSSTVSSSVSTSSVPSTITSSSATSTASSSTVSTSATTSSGVPSASLCPSANGQIVTDSNGNQYNVTCSSDNSVGSYTNAQASTSYLDCMAACDSASSTGCQGFTYVGGANGSGSGTCWLKQSMADYPKSGNNVISAVKIAKSNSGVASIGSSSSSSSSSIGSSTSSSSSSSSVASSSSSSSTVASSSSSSSSVVSSSSSSTSSVVSSTSSSSSIASSSSSVASSSTSSFSSSSIASSSSSIASSSTSSSSIASSSSSSSSIASSSSSSSSSVISSTSSSSTSSTLAPTVTSSASSTSSSAATTFSTSTSSASSSSSSALSLPTGFSSYGCFIDGSPRVLAYSAGSSSTNTPYKCASTCQSLGYKYAGTEYMSECWCSNTAPTSSAKATDCNMACSGDKTQTCGAGNRLSVYVDNNWTQKFSARSSYGTWNLMACYTDNTNGRLLPTALSMTGGASNATIANCLDACAKSGLRVCGAEYYQECYGGSTAPSSSLIAGSASDPLTAGCNYPCSGNSTEACGGSNKILVYINNGTQTTSR